jgi:hypothetical protein
LSPEEKIVGFGDCIAASASVRNLPDFISYLLGRTEFTEAASQARSRRRTWTEEAP